jgi:hypothetical protein
VLDLTKWARAAIRRRVVEQLHVPGTMTAIGRDLPDHIADDHAVEDEIVAVNREAVEVAHFGIGRCSGARRQARAPVPALDAERGAARPAILVRLPGADRLLMTARLGQAEIHVVEVGVLAEPLPEASQVVGAAPLARRALDHEPAPAEVAQALH